MNIEVEAKTRVKVGKKHYQIGEKFALSKREAEELAEIGCVKIVRKHELKPKPEPAAAQISRVAEGESRIVRKGEEIPAED